MLNQKVLEENIYKFRKKKIGKGREQTEVEWEMVATWKGKSREGQIQA